MANTKKAKLSAAQKLSVTCPVCGAPVGKGCSTAKRSVSKTGSTLSLRVHGDRIRAAIASMS